MTARSVTVDVTTEASSVADEYRQRLERELEEIK